MDQLEPPHEYSCEQCDRTFPTEAGVNMHTHRKHNGMGNQPGKEALRKREYRAARKIDSKQADELFKQIGKATDILFPRRVPSDRLIEVAAWQQATLEMLLRQ